MESTAGATAAGTTLAVKVMEIPAHPKPPEAHSDTPPLPSDTRPTPNVGKAIASSSSSPTVRDSCEFADCKDVEAELN